ncbi:MAG TPA: hypothetical protein VND65_01090 [Candidatus Binatia bacterium]|nr:hypothetical protein [Candidatus Binatia bacterium]
MKRFIVLAFPVLFVAGVALLLTPAALAQSCALCYTQAAQSGSRMIEALKSGILILIVPPTLMSVGLIFVCYRKRNQTRAGEEDLDWEWQQAPPEGFSGKR